MAKKNKMTAKDEKFVEEYLLCLNATKAAVAAGFAHSVATASAASWVGKYRDKCPPHKTAVWDAVDAAKRARSEKSGIDALFLLNRLGAMIDADPADIIDENTGAYLRIHDWPLVWRRMLSAADVKELFEANANGDQEKIGQIVKYKFIDPLKAYELVGKHVDVQAWKERVAHEGAIRIDVDKEDEDL